MWKESHEYSDGRCALLRWVQFPSYQIHFVDQYRKYQGNFTTAAMEQYLEKLHGNMSTPDAYFDNRIGFEVAEGDLDDFKSSLRADQVSYYMGAGGPASSSIVMQIPGGILIELMESQKAPPAFKLRGGGGVAGSPSSSYRR